MDGLETALRGLESMRLQWSPVWRAEWANAPDEYVSAGFVRWEGSRRLLRGDDERLGLRVYLGVRHSDPTRWGVAGEPHTAFFASALLGGHTLFLHTYPTATAALAALASAHAMLAGER